MKRLAALKWAACVQQIQNLSISIHVWMLICSLVMVCGLRACKLSHLCICYESSFLGTSELMHITLVRRKRLSVAVTVGPPPFHLPALAVSDERLQSGCFEAGSNAFLIHCLSLQPVGSLSHRLCSLSSSVLNPSYRRFLTVSLL